MDDDTSTVIADTFHAVYRFEDPDEARAVGAMIDYTVRTLPQPDSFVVDPDGTGRARTLLLIGDRLLDLTIDRDDDAGVRMSYEDRPLVDSGVVIQLERFAAQIGTRGLGHRTRWRFKWPDDSEVQVRGGVTTRRMEDPALSGEEVFARAVAGKVGEVMALTKDD
jgi:hypothetical protein